jgi:hypothetical protein
VLSRNIAISAIVGGEYGVYKVIKLQPKEEKLN